MLPANFLQTQPFPVGDAVSDPDAHVRSFEREYGVTFSDMHREILVTYGAPILFAVECAYRPVRTSPWVRQDGSQALEALYGPGDSEDSLQLVNSRLSGRIPKRTVAIGASSGGNQICLSFDEGHVGQIYFWDHEHEVVITGAESDFSNMYLISPTFDDLILRLFARTEEAPPSSTSGIDESKSWLDF